MLQCKTKWQSVKVSKNNAQSAASPAVNKSHIKEIKVPFRRQSIEIPRFTASLCRGSAINTGLIRGIMSAWFSIHISGAWRLYHRREEKLMKRWASSDKMIAGTAMNLVIRIIGFLFNHRDLERTMVILTSCKCCQSSTLVKKGKRPVDLAGRMADIDTDIFMCMNYVFTCFSLKNWFPIRLKFEI